jgi:hypothetical protein
MVIRLLRNQGLSILRRQLRRLIALSEMKEIIRRGLSYIKAVMKNRRLLSRVYN